MNEQDLIKEKEILEYCICYLTNKNGYEVKEFRETKLYKEMLEELNFILNNN